MTKTCFGRRLATVVFAAVNCLVFAATPVGAQNTGRLSGYVYVDRNNDGVLAFSSAAHPELVINNVTISLSQLVGTSYQAVTSMVTSSQGLYAFTGLAAGTYRITQTQPIQFVDGLDTLGVLRDSSNVVLPTGPNNGTVANNMFSGIVLGAGGRGDLYNFGELGLAPAYVSKRYLLGTADAPVFPDPVVIPDPESAPEPTAGVLAAISLVALRKVARRRSR